MFLVEKGKSAVHRVKTALFKKSGRWDKHPLNVEPPKTDWQELDRQLVALTSQLPFTIRDFDCDAYAVSLHKWLLAPFGTGILYVRRDRIASFKAADRARRPWASPAA